MLYIIFLFFNLLTTLLLAKFSYSDNILKLINRYKRPITVLEIGGKSTPYIFYLNDIIESKNGVYISLFLDDLSLCKECIDKIKYKNYVNNIIVQGGHLDYKDWTIFSKCEHIDIVIVNDVYDNYFDYSKLEQVLNSLVKIGEYTFLKLKRSNFDIINHINLQPKKIIDSKEKNLLMSVYYRKKSFIQLIRWTKKNMAENDYFIISNFLTKKFYKNGGKKVTNWIPGINLKTFVMLKGIYPNDYFIYNFFLDISKRLGKDIPYHNDLVIGNVIIQGHRLELIDFGDNRRNANTERCIRRALHLFNGDGTRFKDPEERLRQYTKEK